MTDKISFTALVLAGDRQGENLVADEAGVQRKVLSLISGRPMAAYCLQALASSEKISRVIILSNQSSDIEEGLADYLPEGLEIQFMEGESSPVRSVLAYVKSKDIQFPLLIMTADNPLITARITDEFLEAALGEQAEFVVGLASETSVEKRFPGAGRTYYHFSDENYTGCNLYVMFGAGATRTIEFWTKVENKRKKMVKILWAFGPLNALAVLLGRYSLDRAFVRASKVLKTRIRPVILEDGSAAMDVDRPMHLKIASDVIDLARENPKDQ